MIHFYHNNRCSKSRAAKALLEASGHAFQAVYYLESPLSKSQLQRILKKGDFSAVDLVRFGDAQAKALGISKTDNRADEQWCELVAEHPQLMQRPIVETADQAVIGRPVENIQRLLDSL